MKKRTIKRKRDINNAAKILSASLIRTHQFDEMYDYYDEPTVIAIRDAMYKIADNLSLSQLNEVADLRPNRITNQ